jgi:hypothetical protein
MGMQPKATLEDKFNDDYEPVRCQLGGVPLTSAFPSSSID